MARPAKTSSSHPLRVDWLRVPWSGQVGLTFAPGKKQLNAATGAWDRDLDTDLRRLRHDLRVDHLVCLLEDHEFDELEISGLEVAAGTHGLDFSRFAIPDGGTPADGDALRTLVLRISRWAAAGENTVIYCKGGLGRAGTVGGCVLRAAGLDGSEVMEVLAEARGPNCPETRAQRDYIRGFAPLAGPAPRREGT